MISKKLKLKVFIAFLLIGVSGSQAFAAKVPVEEVLDSATVKQQIDYVLLRSTTYEEYKVIKRVWINKLRGNILDSLNLANTELHQRDKALASRGAELDSIHANLSDLKVKLAEVTKEKNSLKVFGILINKATFNTIISTIILGLLATLFFILFMYRRSLKVTNQTKSDLTEIKHEFEEHRKKSREREEKMARRHLDEILKYKNNA